MTQKRPPPRGPQRKKKLPPELTPLRTRVIMATFGVSVLLVLFYFFNDLKFPTDITYKNVQPSGDGPYAHQRENPRPR